MREIDVASTKTVFRLIRSIPSPKAEPFKLWLAEVGNDRINESQDPELTIDRAQRGGKIARDARKSIEVQTKKLVISSKKI